MKIENGYLSICPFSPGHDRAKRGVCMSACTTNTMALQGMMRLKVCMFVNVLAILSDNWLDNEIKKSHSTHVQLILFLFTYE